MIELRRPQKRRTNDLIEGNVVYWRKPNLNEGAGKFSVPNHGPYVVMCRTAYTAKLKHLHTGVVHKIPVNISHLRKAGNDQLPPDVQGVVRGPLYSRCKDYRSQPNETKES